MNEEIFVNIGIPFIYNDGGRKESGYAGDAGDCVVRAISIASQKSYQEVYNDLWKEQSKTRDKKSPRDGVKMKVIKIYLKSLDWSWIPTMGIGTGCKIHLHAYELPVGRLIVRVSKHLCAVIDRTLQDTYDCSRQGTRCVYGYWLKK